MRASFPCGAMQAHLCRSFFHALNLSEAEGIGRFTEAAAGQSRTLRTKTSGTEVIHLNGTEVFYLDFGNIQGALKGCLSLLGVKRLWLLIDEWSEIPIELQPYLADMLHPRLDPGERSCARQGVYCLSYYPLSSRSPSPKWNRSNKSPIAGIFVGT